MSFHKNTSDLNAVRARRGCSSTWTPCVLYVQKMSILSLYHGLDLLIIHWSYVTLCALHCGKGIVYGDFVIICYWIFFWNFNMTFHHVYCQHISWILCNFSCKPLFQIIMTIGLYLIPINFSAPHLKTVSRNFFILFAWWGVMVVVISENIIFKMSYLSALLLLQLVTMVSRMHSETRRLCQNNRFPTVQGFTYRVTHVGLSRTAFKCPCASKRGGASSTRISVSCFICLQISNEFLQPNIVVFRHTNFRC